MNVDDSRLIARFQLLTTEMLIEKRLGQRRPELTDDSIRYGWNLTNAQNEERKCSGHEARDWKRTQVSTTRTHFTFRVDS